jgi:hypothetical protein
VACVNNTSSVCVRNVGTELHLAELYICFKIVQFCKRYSCEILGIYPVVTKVMLHSGHFQSSIYKALTRMSSIILSVFLDTTFLQNIRPIALSMVNTVSIVNINKETILHHDSHVGLHGDCLSRRAVYHECHICIRN